MKTHFSDPNFAKQLAERSRQILISNPPPILFAREKKGKDEDETVYKRLDLRIDPDDEKNLDTFTKKVRVFEEGSPEEWIKWCIDFSEVERAKPLSIGESKVSMARVLLKGRAKDIYETKLSEMTLSVTPKPTANVCHAAALDQLGKTFFKTAHATRRQRAYMRQGLFIGK
jgi:hypothetical protein